MAPAPKAAPAPSKAWLQATGVAQDVRDLESGAMAALLPAIAAAQKELQHDLAAWYAKLGPTAATDKFTVAQLRQVQLLLGVAEASGSSKAKYPHASFPFIASKAVLGVMQKAEAPTKAVNTLVGELTSLRGKFADMPSPQLIHAAMLAKGDHLVLDRYANSAKRYAGQVKDDLKFQFGVGLSKGETIQQLTTRIAGLAGFRAAVDASHPNDAAQATAGALAKRYHNWAKRLAITELNNAYNKTAADGIKEAHKLDDRVRLMWDATNDMRVCPICRDLHGEMMDPGEPSSTFPGGYTQPPAHPYCRCSVVAWMAEWDENAADVPMPPSAEEVEAAEAAAAKAEQDALAEQESNANRRAAASHAAKTASHEDLEAYQDHKAAEALEKQLAEAEAKHQAALAQAAKEKAEAEAAAAKAKAEADALAAKIAADQAHLAALQKAADELAAKQAAETKAAHEAQLQAQAAAEAKAAAEKAAHDQEVALQAYLAKKQAEADAKKLAAKEKAKAKKLAAKATPAPFDMATSPKLKTTFFKKGTGEAALLKHPGMVQIDKNTIVGHGYEFKWADGKWKSWSSPTTYGNVEWDPSANNWQGAWKATGTPLAWQVAAGVTTPTPAPTPPPPVFAPPPVTKITGPKPEAITGHEWKQSNGEWLLYKNGSTIPTKDQVIQHPLGGTPKQLPDTYTLGAHLAQAGLVPTGPGKMEGHGFTYTKQPNGIWAKSAWLGTPIPLPESVTNANAPGSDYVNPYNTHSHAPPVWKPSPIKLAPNRGGVTDFDAHPSHEFHGIHGKAFTQDGDIVEGGSVRVVKVKGSDGEVYYETMFKVTHPYGAAIKDYGTGASNSWTFNQRSVKAGVMTDTGGTKEESVKTRVRQVGKTRVDIGTSGAVTNQVRIRAASLSELNAAMDHLSEHVGGDIRKPPEKEDLVLQAKARIAAKFNPAMFGQGMKTAASPDDQKAVINKTWDAMVAKHPIMAKALADAKEVEVYPGHKTLYSEALGKHLADLWGHMYHEGSPPAAITAGMIAQGGKVEGGTGLMSSVKRYNSGIFATGMSTSEDFRTGGADGVFMRVSTQATSHSIGGYSPDVRFVIDTKPVMGRLDWWSFNSDEFGKAGYDSYGQRWDIPTMQNKHAGGSNEIMATNGVPSTTFKKVICKTAAYRTEVIKNLKDQGLTHVNGIKVEDFVVLNR